MTTCQMCPAPGIPYLEPAGTWCPRHRPVLWDQPDNPWSTVACHICHAPAGWPRQSRNRPVCRKHAPTRIARYLTGDPA